MRSSAFTLIEAMAAVLLVGILAAGVALSFAAPLRRARAQDAIDRVRAFDSSARAQATASGRPVLGIIDLSNGALERRDAASSETISRQQLPDGIRIDLVRCRDRRDDVGAIEIEFSPLGLSPSYAVHLAGPECDRWIMVAGLSGSIGIVRDEAQVDAILTPPRAAGVRRDAD